jgi:hypothetical protein
MYLSTKRVHQKDFQPAQKPQILMHPPIFWSLPHLVIVYMYWCSEELPL